MRYLPATSRVWSLDILRGFYILVMVMAHSIFFFHQGRNTVFLTINNLADTISFTGLLFISGVTGYIAYIHERHPVNEVKHRVIKRLVVYLVSYYLLAIFADGILNGFSFIESLKVIGFLKLVPFTEFIVAFIVYGVLKLPLRASYQYLAKRPQILMPVGIGLYLIGTLIAQYQLPIPPGWQAIFVGAEGWYSFPVFQYALVYLMGVRLGRLYWERTSKAEQSREIVYAGVASLGISVVFAGLHTVFDWNMIAIDQRFPPSLTFILSGVLVALSLFWMIARIHRLTRVTSIKLFVILLGQNAFAIFFTHTLLLYIYIGIGFPPIYSSLLTSILYVLSLVFSLWLARMLPFNYQLGLTFVGWCECVMGECEHPDDYHQHQFQTVTRRWQRFADLTSFPVGRKMFRIARMRHLVTAAGLIFLVATPLGIAENNLLMVRLIEESRLVTNRNWYIPKFTNAIQVSYTPASELQENYAIEVAIQVDDLEPVPLRKQFQTYGITLPMSEFSYGEHLLTGLVTLDDKPYMTQPITLHISAPVYTTWTIDWEGYDVNDVYLDALISIAEQQRIPMTHLFNPRIYTNPDISGERATYLTEWVINRKQVFDEEIGLHLHMFPDFAQAAGLTPKEEPVWGGGFSPGYDILTTTYDQEEMEQLLSYAKAVFGEKGLGQPRSYRAGAWFADITTLKALENSEFLVDSSGRTAYRFGTNRVSGYWQLNETAQPYYPSSVNQNASTPTPNLKILEVPNNGADSYAYSGSEMVARFEANYPGGVTNDKRQVTFLSHPHWFNQTRQQAMIQVFEHINGFRYEDDLGPVIPTTLTGVYQAWSE
jgi:hypothetical protein